jgi:site-specific DNA-methyltransferase (adenine-specific)
MTTWRIETTDCLSALREMPPDSIDSIVTDPPYGLAFMNKRWDYDVPSVEIWEECLRVLKPGGHLLAFAGARTQHRMAVRIEDAGFEIRDMIAWIYGSGFPKSLDVSKAIDKAAGAEREVVGCNPNSRPNMVRVNAAVLSPRVDAPITAPATPEAQQWQGWGTALKPALEPITVARKPLIGTVAANVLRHGTGGINVDGCRVGMRDVNESGWSATGSKAGANLAMSGNNYDRGPKDEAGTGRWPANLIHDGSPEVVGLFPQSKSGVLAPHHKRGENRDVYGKYNGTTHTQTFGGDSGSAARFFYHAKASKADRNAGCDALPERAAAECVEREEDSAGMASPCAGAGRTSGARNHHPTVKPTDLMRYLCRLVTPPGGTVLDPFMGSGSTGKAAVLEGFNFIGIEREAEYVQIAKARIAAAR